MAIADIFNVPTSDAEMATWSFNHMVHHREINSAILAKSGIALPEYILDPINLAAGGAFFDQHQQMHNNTDAILGVSGYDLTEVNWADAGQRAGWIYLNATLHVAEANELGVF